MSIAYWSIGSAVAAMLHWFRARRLLLAAHSLGGTLAAIVAALHPRVVRGLLLVEAPLRFGQGAGALGSLAALASFARDASHPRKHPIPGSLISALGVAADPAEFIAGRWLDGLACAADADALAAHLRVVQWTLDELAMPERLFGEMAVRLCRDDEFHRGALRIAGRHAAPDRLAMPVLAVLDPSSRLVPPRSVLPFLQDARGARTLYWHREELRDRRCPCRCPGRERRASVPLAEDSALVARRLGRQADTRLLRCIERWEPRRQISGQQFRDPFDLQSRSERWKRSGRAGCAPNLKECGTRSVQRSFSTGPVILELDPGGLMNPRRRLRVGAHEIGCPRALLLLRAALAAPGARPPKMREAAVG